tara:strand:- start:2530 stop:3003 length:474 start_codon:yes stop_codon:yes gene_type:complete
MDRYSIDEVCEQLSITRQGLNARCRKLGIEKTREGKRAYFSSQQIKILKRVGKLPEGTRSHREGVDPQDKLIDRLLDENNYLRKKLDEESENLKGAMSVILQNNERIRKLETENNKLLEYNKLDDIVENDYETERKQKVSTSKRKWYSIFTGGGDNS